MSGQLWALIAGVGFGIFQSSNRRAVAGLDVYVSTFLQLVISALVLAPISLAAGGLGLLRAAPLPAVANFAAAGLFHFFIGWTFLNASQKRIGAARTSPFIGTVPLFATFIAAFTLQEVPEPLALAGVAIVVAGVFILSSEKSETHAPIGRGGAVVGLSAALCWSISPIFIRRGLVELPSPLLGLTIGILAAVAAYGVLMLFGLGARGNPISLDAIVFKVIAGTLVGLSQWARWTALGLAPVGVVLALTQVSTPVTILISPLLVGRQIEHVTARVWLGAAVVVAGSSVLVLVR